MCMQNWPFFPSKDWACHCSESWNVVLRNWGKNRVFFQISVYKLSWLLKNLLCHSYVLTRVSKYHSLEKHPLASAWFLSWGKNQKLLAAALFMSDGYTVYILKHLECEQLPLLLSHQVSYSLYKLQFITKEMSASPSSSPPVLALPGRLPVAPTRLAVHRRLSTSSDFWQHTRLRLNGASRKEPGRLPQLRSV